MDEQARIWLEIYYLDSLHLANTHTHTHTLPLQPPTPLSGTRGKDLTHLHSAGPLACHSAPLARHAARNGPVCNISSCPLSIDALSPRFPTIKFVGKNI